MGSRCDEVFEGREGKCVKKCNGMGTFCHSLMRVADERRAHADILSFIVENTQEWFALRHQLGDTPAHVAAASGNYQALSVCE